MAEGLLYTSWTTWWCNFMRMRTGVQKHVYIEWYARMYSTNTHTAILLEHEVL